MSMTLEGNGPERTPRPTPQVASSHVLDLFKMTDRVVCVTGAASGIGYAACEAMAEAGAHVAMFYNSNAACVQKAEALAKQCGVKVKAYQVQVTDAEAVKKAVDQVVADFGKLDCFVANAGMAVSKPILEISLEDWRKMSDVNYHGVAYSAMAAGAVFKKQGFGNFIATSSMSASIVNVPVLQSGYNASKAAVTHLCKSLAVEWRDFARVNIVSPGFHHTDMGASPGVVQEALRMTPLGRQGDVRELKGAYLYLASDASSFCTGTDLLVDGGYTLP